MNYSTPPSSSRTSEPFTYRNNLQNTSASSNAAQANLFNAIKNHDGGNFEVILDEALHQGASLHAADEHGLIPLEVAVLSNQPRVVQALMSRGSPMPVVPENGFDLAMLSAFGGYSETLLVLLHVCDMQPDAQDQWGATALHYAVIGGHLQAAIALLDKEANPDLFFTRDIEPEMRQRTRIPEDLSHAGTTALMLAVALQNCPMAELLLSRGASATAGVRYPLEIAIRNNDLPMVELLLKKNIGPNAMRLSNGRSLLSLSIQHHCSLALVKKILQPTVETPEGLHALDMPLHIAIETGQHEIVACLLCQGANIESAEAPAARLWHLASHLNDQGKMLNILVNPRIDQAIRLFTKNGRWLAGFCQFASQPTALAPNGIFPTAIAPALPALQDLAMRSRELNPAQIEFEAAYCLYLLGTPPVQIHSTNSSSAINLRQATIEEVFINGISRNIAAQVHELQAIGRQQLTNQRNFLITTSTSDFFHAALKGFGPEYDLLTSLENLLKTEHGLPDSVARVIASAWVVAYEKARQIHDHPDAVRDLLLCTENLLLTVIENSLTDKFASRGSQRPTEIFCLNVLMNAVTNRRTSLDHFTSDPVDFLSSLATNAADTTRSEQAWEVTLCTQLGLPTALCKKIYQAWHSANSEASVAVPSGHPRRVHDFLSRAMANSLKAILIDSHQQRQAGEIVMPARLQGRLQQWCDRVLMSPQDDATERNDEQRPKKRARFNE